jgi:hypothetical protein
MLNFDPNRVKNSRYKSKWVSNNVEDPCSLNPDQELRLFLNPDLDPDPGFLLPKTKRNSTEKD